MAEAMGAMSPLLAELLPDIEPVLIRALKSEGDDDDESSDPRRD